MTDDAVRPDAEADSIDPIIAAYLEAAQVGTPPDRAALLAKYPALADELRAFFTDLDQFTALATPLRLDRAAADPLATVPEGATIVDAPAAGRSFGDYELLGEIARGAMGVVYRARQRSLNRVVALKMILAGQFASPDEVRRFRTDPESAAALDHPNIVPIYEAGAHDGHHFFSMKLMEGGSLARAREPGSRVGPKEAARLVATAARAVHHAHQRGILHRDLKPANILLDATGEPHVTDFGLAKRVAGGVKQTQPGAIVGTPAYMAPEQANGRGKPVTTAADVYGLGAVLYELLAGRPPFQAATVFDTLAQVLHDEPARPSRLAKGVPYDLETICLKCLRKGPERRYASAAGLADDLERFRAGEPIQARPLSVWGSGLKWARRRPAVAALLAISAAALLILLGGGAWFTTQLRAERDNATEERDRAQAQKQLARENLRKSCDAVERLLSRTAEERLLRQPGMTALRRALLQDAASFYEEFVRQGGDDPWVRAETGRAYRQLAYVQAQMGQWDRVTESSQRAIDLLEPLRAEDPAERAHRWQLSLAYQQLGEALVNQGRSREAESAYRTAIARVAELASEAPGDATYRRHLAYFRAELGESLLGAGRLREAGEEGRQALAVAEKLSVDFPAEPQGRKILGWCQNRAGNYLFVAGRLPEAEKALHQALDTYQKLRAEAPSDTDVSAEAAETFVILSDVLRVTGRLPEATEACRQALSLTDKWVEEFPALVSPRETHASAGFRLALLLEALGQPREADRVYQRADAALERLAAGWPGVAQYRRELANSRAERAGSLHETNPGEAERLCRRALALAEQLIGEAPEVPGNGHLLVQCRRLLAYVLMKTGRAAEAEDLCRRTLPLAQKLATEFPAEAEPAGRLTAVHRIYGQALADSARPQEAESAFRRAAEVAEKVAAEFPDNPGFRFQPAFAYEELMELLSKDASRAREVEDIYLRDLELVQKAATDFPHDLTFPEHLSHWHRGWAFFLQDHDRLPEAEDALRRAVLVLDQLLADFPGARPRFRVLLADTYVCLARVLATAGKREAAAEALRRFAEFPPPSDAGNCNHLAETLVAIPDTSLVDPRRAVELAKKAVELAPADALCWQTLGMARCRAAEWKAAAEALEKSNALGVPGYKPIMNAFLLAIAHWHLGHKEQARCWFDEGVASFGTHPPPNANYRRLRDETEKLIGVGDPPME